MSWGETDPELEVRLPIRDYLKDQSVGCSGCLKRAGFTLREFERGPATFGWQLRLIATECRAMGKPARSWRWDLFCPACAGEANPRPQGRERLGAIEPVDIRKVKRDEP